MSAPGSNQPAGEEKPDGLSRVIKRMRTVLRRGKPKKESTPGGSGVAAPRKEEKPKAEKSEAAATQPSAPATTSKPLPKDESSTAPKGSVSGVRKVDANARILEQREKAKRMFARHGLNLEDHEWIITPRDPVERVEKPIRMRVRYTCHRCQTTFGSGSKMCSSCSHHRCKTCTRYPPRKPKGSKAAAASETIALPEKKPKRRSEALLTLPSRSGGQDLVRKPIRQRVRRTCHKCGGSFQARGTLCNGCEHERCSLCPRDPAKLHKYPEGYPGDLLAEEDGENGKQAEPKRAKIRVRWTCHSCSKFLTEGEATCTGCGHDRCKECKREPPRKVKPEPDPEVLKSLQRRLEALKVDKPEEGS